MGSGGQTGLEPTLWRTCRVLANRVRLRILQVLFRDGELPVSAVAERAGVSTVVASQFLRALGARGLLAARRQGRWVFYRPAADPSVRGTAELVRALKRTFAGGREPAETVYRQATAFTHPRRVQIVRALADGPLAPAELARRTRISRFALRRHLAKLARRGFARRSRDAWRTSCPPGPLACTLRHLAAES